MQNRYPTRTPKRLRKPLFIIGAVVLAIAALVAILEVTNTTHLFHSGPVAVSGNAETKGEGTDSNAKNSDSSSGLTKTNNDEPGDNKSGGGGSSTVTLLAPSGDFVSNHHPNLSGNPAPNTISSVCTTTPGATCQISFTKDGVTKTLPRQITDRGGSTYWNNWKLQDIGLTAGDWQVQASAALNSKTSTAGDALQLVIAE